MIFIICGILAAVSVGGIACTLIAIGLKKIEV
jgi:hypothetical protein